MAKKYTTNEDEIRGWIEERGGIPVLVTGVEENGKESPEMLHIAFGPLVPDMEEIDWEEFFERIENEQLALEYDDATPRGQIPDFEFVDRERELGEFYPESDLPDSGDPDVLRNNIIPDSDGE